MEGGGEGVGCTVLESVNYGGLRDNSNHSRSGVPIESKYLVHLTVGIKKGSQPSPWRCQTVKRYVEALSRLSRDKG